MGFSWDLEGVTLVGESGLELKPSGLKAESRKGCNLENWLARRRYDLLAKWFYYFRNDNINVRHYYKILDNIKENLENFSNLKGLSKTYVFNLSLLHH